MSNLEPWLRATFADGSFDEAVPTGAQLLAGVAERRGERARTRRRVLAAAASAIAVAAVSVVLTLMPGHRSTSTPPATPASCVRGTVVAGIGPGPHLGSPGANLPTPYQPPSGCSP
jgi:hypothetical protein